MTGLTQHNLRIRLLRTAFRGLTPALLAVILAGAAAAQNAPAPDDQEPPALVGRISAIHGSASIQRADAQDWADAGLNEPVTIGDAVYSPKDSDVRLQIGATDLDLQSDSEIDIAQLDDNAGTIRLDSGVLDLRVSALPTADGLSIATPRGTVRLTQPGIYSIDAGDENDPTRVTAFTGSARLGDSAAAVSVQQGQVLIIAGTPDAPTYSYSSDVGDYPSEWRTPPRIVQVRESERYVAPEMTGAEDLYQYGSFESAPDYGTVWYPRDVPAGWQPYRYGHWEYVRPWGQTWVDDRPWGFAPFHYGRWAFIGNRWGWVPGQYTPHPVYAPALVAFVGGGGLNVSVSIGGGGGFGRGGAIGWVPLAPGEGYHPPYRASQTYIQNINRTTIVNKTVIINNNNTTINNNRQGGFGANGQPQTMAGFANRRFATVVPAEAIAQRRPVAQAAVQVKPEQLDKAQVNAEAVREIKPVPAAMRAAANPGPVARPANPRQAANARPALPPARNRPGQQPAAAQPGKPGQPPAPNAQQHPGTQPAAVPPAAAAPRPQRPDNRPAPAVKPGPDAKPAPATKPAPEAKPAPENKPTPMPPRGKPGMQRPQAQGPGPQTPQGAERPAVNRPETQPQQRPQVKPAERPAPAPRPEAQARPQRPEARPQPAAPKPEARPAQAQRPEPRPQAAPRPQPQQPRPQAQPQQPKPHPEAQAPRPPQPQQRPQPQPQQQPHPQHKPGKDKTPDDNK
jgi:hypothetical protein